MKNTEKLGDKIMNKNSISRKYSLVVFAGVLVLLSMAACTSDTSLAQFSESERSTQVLEVQAVLSDGGVDVNSVEDDGYSTFQPIALNEAQNSQVYSELSEEEAAGLFFMREEEKLARDVYIRLYEQWGLPVFQNISQSEQAHTEAVKTLLDSYGLEDPVSIDEVGVFTDSVLQELYNQLIIQGNQSLSDALKVGATIEEIDILDLETRLEQTDKPDIQRVYGNLLNGSMNHLRAFVSTLQRQTGEDYSSQYLSQEAFDAIIAGGMQGGGPGGQGRSYGGNGNQTSRGNGRGG
jgi:hypothetical protein